MAKNKNKGKVDKEDTKGKKDRASDEDDDDEEGTKDVSAALAALDEDGDEWSDTPEGGFSDVPDGKYQVQITNVNINHAKSSGRLQISYEMTILSGKLKGRKVFKHDGISEAQQRAFARGSLAKLGVEWPKKAVDLADVLADEVQDSFAQIQVITKKKSEDSFVNIYFQKAIDEDQVDLEDSEDEDEAEDKNTKRKEVSLKGKKNKKAKEEPEEDEDEDEDGDEDDDTSKEDVEDDSEEDSEDDEEEKPKGKKGSKKKQDEEDEEKSEDEDEDEDKEDESEDEESSEDEDEGDSDEGVNVKFKDKSLDKKQIKRVLKLSDKLDFSKDDYSTVTDMLSDMGEYVGLSGTFDEAEELITEVESAKVPKAKK